MLLLMSLVFIVQIIIVTLVSYLATFATRFGVKVVGDIPPGYVKILYRVC